MSATLSLNGLLISIIAGTALVNGSCVTPQSHDSPSAKSLPAASPVSDSPERLVPPAASSPSPSPKTEWAQIRSTDFNRVTYANDKNARPTYMSYGDVTNDGSEEAMAVISIANRGSAILHHVYVFTIENRRPKLLWSFETGDRADGGIRQIYAQQGQLVVELFGKDRIIGKELFKGDEPLCCPKSYTQTRYRWTDKKFDQVSAEVLPNPQGNVRPVMELYNSRN